MSRSQSELLGMRIVVDDIFDFVGNEFRRPYVLALKLVRACHIFNVGFKHSPNNIEKSKVELFEICIPGRDVQGDPHQIHFEITWLRRIWKVLQIYNLKDYMTSCFIPLQSSQNVDNVNPNIVGK